MAATRERHVRVFQTLRQRIVAGELKPGERLPTRHGLRSEFSVCLGTLQRALDQLAQDGFVHGRPGAGTFVSLHPPHLANIALVYPASVVTSRFVTAMRDVVCTLGSDDAVRFQEYSISTVVDDIADRQRLIADAREHRIAGILFIFPPTDLQGTPALTEVGIPRVAACSSPQYGTPSVSPDPQSFRDRAIDYLLSRNRRRIAHIYADAPHTLSPQDFARTLYRPGLPVLPHWVQPVGWSAGYRSAASVIQLMMQLEGSKRPDGLVLHDDNLVQPVSAGIVAAGIDVPGDLEIVAETNFPSIVPSVVPMRRLGFDCNAIVAQCLQLLRQQRDGEVPARQTLSPAVFEEELMTQRAGPFDRKMKAAGVAVSI